jgi:quinoprotein glucose dehydrogenase
LGYDAREMTKRATFVAAIVPTLLACAALSTTRARTEQDLRSGAGAATGKDWPAYGGGPENTHYSTLSQINRSNVKQLREAWTYDTGESGGLETSPLIVDGVLYGITPSQKIFAVDAATGKQRWIFDSGIAGTQPNRGLAYWSGGAERRILVGVMNYVYALDAATGRPIASFGDGGRIDLREGLGRDPATVWTPLTSPGIVFEDLLIVGGRDPETLPAAPGDIRAYDVRTGQMRWAFHTIPHPGEFGYETWPADAWKYSGAANNWAGMSLDAKRGIVYVPTGSAAMDFYGANRVGDDLFANCLLALDARTGKRLWHFQGVRHDLWDRDFPAPPVLVTVKRGGRDVDAVAQTTKQGVIYLFDRTTGDPLFPIKQRPAKVSVVPGEVAAKTQPWPTEPAPFARQLLTEDLLTRRTTAAHEWAVHQFREFRSEGQFVPFRIGKETVIFPGFDGGAEWGGPAVDPATATLYVNANEMAWTGGLAPNAGRDSPRAIYMSQCSVCHGQNMAGSPPAIPSLIGITSRMKVEQVYAAIEKGKGRMNGFPNLTAEQRFELVQYISGTESEVRAKNEPMPPGMDYQFTGYHKFLDPDGYPAIAPPWGTLSAINLNTGDYVWRVNLGEYPELAAQGTKNTGSENYGGPIVTTGGLLFIGATDFDRKFRAFDKDTGELLWETTLPFPGNATPATYEVGGRQFVAIAAGGGKDPKSASGGVYVAFALPGGEVKGAARSGAPSAPSAPEKIIIDTDIGDDIDDAFALALALRSPQLQILGVTTTFGDTLERAKLADRMLGEAGRADIPVAIGTATRTPQNDKFTQRAYADGGAFVRPSHPDAAEFILGQIRQHPREITLVAIGPLCNVGALLDKDAGTFRKLKRVVMMGGSVRAGYGTSASGMPSPPQPEWNILNDVASARKLFDSGVPIYMMPLDSTQLKMNAADRAAVFGAGTPLTRGLEELYHEWGQETPTLFDPFTIAYILEPHLCTEMEPLQIRVDDDGMTRPEQGAPNANVCLRSDAAEFFRFYLGRFVENRN